MKTKKQIEEEILNENQACAIMNRTVRKIYRLMSIKHLVQKLAMYNEEADANDQDHEKIMDQIDTCMKDIYALADILGVPVDLLKKEIELQMEEDHEQALEQIVNDKVPDNLSNEDLFKDKD